MRRLLTVVVAVLLGFSAPAFAQSAPPVLIDQGTAQAAASPAGAGNADDALAQVPDQGPGGFFNNPLIVAGLITAAIAIPVAIALSNNDTDETVSP